MKCGKIKFQYSDEDSMMFGSEFHKSCGILQNYFRSTLRMGQTTTYQGDRQTILDISTTVMTVIYDI